MPLWHFSKRCSRKEEESKKGTFMYYGSPKMLSESSMSSLTNWWHLVYVYRFSPLPMSIPNASFMSSGVNLSETRLTSSSNWLTLYWPRADSLSNMALCSKLSRLRFGLALHWVKKNKSPHRWTTRKNPILTVALHDQADRDDWSEDFIISRFLKVVPMQSADIRFLGETEVQTMQCNTWKSGDKGLAWNVR